MITEITNHVEEAQGFLISQYKNKPNVLGLVGALATPAQEAESAIMDLETKRGLGGEGVQLDNLGTVVGIARTGGQSDADYLRAIKAQIVLNTSEGQPTAIVSAFQLLTSVSQVIFDEFFPCAVMVESPYQPVSQQDGFSLNEIIDTVAAGGVRMEGVVAYDANAAFSFDGPVQGAGFGDLNNQAVGGIVAQLYQPGGIFAFAGPDTDGEGFGTNDDPLVGGLLSGL